MRFDAARPVTILAAGGTIAMSGERARPALEPAELVRAVPELAGADLEVRSLRNLAGAEMGLDDALLVARTAAEETERGRGVVVTHGTDTIEETALLCDLLCDAEAPVVVTGAIRPASATGADGPANLRDAVAAAGAAATAGLGALVAFAGELHAARTVRKVDSVSPAAFGSPRTGPLGAVREGRVTVWAAVTRRAPIRPERLDARVEIVPTSLGDDGALLRAAAGAADGVVIVLLGAGHAPPGFLAALREVAARAAAGRDGAARARRHPARDLWLRGSGGRRARRGRHSRRRPLARRGAHQAPRLPGRGPDRGCAARRLRGGRRLATQACPASARSRGARC